MPKHKTIKGTIAEIKKEVLDKATPADKTKSASTQTVTRINSAGSMLAAGFIYGQDAINLLTDLDSTITDLANLKFPAGKCKALEERGDSGDTRFIDKQIAAVTGCAPYADSFAKAYNADSAGEKLEQTTKGLLQMAEAILSDPAEPNRLIRCWIVPRNNIVSF